MKHKPSPLVRYDVYIKAKKRRIRKTNNKISVNETDSYHVMGPPDLIKGKQTQLLIEDTASDDDDDKIDNIIGKILDIDINKFKYDKNAKSGIISWLLDLI